jgi:acetylornithine deacetylase/succinyl-diaminopimelate desuccinylase-like protein
MSGVPVDELRERVQRLMPRAREELARMVSLQSVYDPRSRPHEDCERMVDLTAELFSGVGLQEVHAHETSDGSKAVCGHLPGPPGAPTVLLYFHHDVQPALDEKRWDSPAWELTERDGRWYGRGAADCKGNIVAHLTALRALGGELPVEVKIVGEGSEELGDGGLEDFVPQHADLLRADAILICDAGNSAAGTPSLTTTLRGVVEVSVTVRTLTSPMHSGMFGGAAPDALTALIHMLATLHDDRGNTTVRGLDNGQTWTGASYPPEQFRKDANVRDGVDLLGDSVAEMIWARPALTVLGIDCPAIAGASASIQPQASALVSLRVPPGMDAGTAQEALISHLRAVAPWHVEVDCEQGFAGQPFTGSVGDAAFQAMADAMQAVYGREVSLQGSGGSIPLCNVFQETFPDAEIMLLGVEEPQCLIHAPNESVDPNEIEAMALVEALFLQSYGVAPRPR